jgi:hypothetical protein
MQIVLKFEAGRRTKSLIAVAIRRVHFDVAEILSSHSSFVTVRNSNSLGQFGNEPPPSALQGSDNINFKHFNLIVYGVTRIEVDFQSIEVYGRGILNRKDKQQEHHSRVGTQSSKDCNRSWAIESGTQKGQWDELDVRKG